jgi:flagellar assembly factor FliW
LKIRLISKKIVTEALGIMEINTKYHGTKTYEAEDIIDFKRGLPGFETLNKFILFSVEENEVFNVLHSIEDETIGLIVVSPFSIIEDYEINLADNVVEALKIKKEADVMIVNTVTLNSELKNTTVNLKAPIIININERLGEQIILDDGKYSIKHPLIQE